VRRRAFLRAGGLVATGAALTGSAAFLSGEAEAGGTPRAFVGIQEPLPADAAGASSTKVIWRVETDRKLIALTLDDGPVPDYTTRFLDMLQDKKVRATFCLIGRHALAHPDLVARQRSLGHELENHSETHADLGKASVAAATREVVRGAQIVEQVSGRRPQFFRPPRGMVSGAALAAAGRVHADVLMWSLQLHEPTMTVQQNVDHVLTNIAPGTILLAHDARHRSIDRRIGLAALPVIIDGLRDRGYEFVTMSELVAAGRSPQSA
jgi:peptidoglycan/xylan/chitin deacetylase (PgdA/CDA1 family)